MTDRSTATPAAARRMFRGGTVTPTAGWCDGWTQANLLTVPKEVAWDFLLFAQRNPKPCPVLDVLDAGDVTGPLLDGDIRTDIPRYRVYVDGELVDEPTDVTQWWRDDLVSFLIGCSFTFESALLEASVPVRHIEQETNVAMYRTSTRCRSAGAMSGPLVVSMRPVPAALVAAAVRVTSRYPSVHGAP
ncbi:MAG: D-glutamate cyclase family protein, partial [Nocardioidaceae bacterium]